MIKPINTQKRYESLCVVLLHTTKMRVVLKSALAMEIEIKRNGTNLLVSNSSSRLLM